MSSTCICIGCGFDTVKNLIDLGPQPPSNRFLVHHDDPSETHPLRFGYCKRCGLGQLTDPMPIETVRSRFEWITYNEPEGHLDDLVEALSARIQSPPNPSIVGVTYKDDSTLARFTKREVTNIYRLDQALDLDIKDPLASLETIQVALTVESARPISSRVGQADIVLVRHILEHAHRPLELLEACHQLGKPGGWLVFEVPDCRKILDGNDHCFLWEEHISYFTPETLENLLEGAGFSGVDIRIYPYPMEDSLVAIVRNTGSPKISHPRAIASELNRLEIFASSLSKRGAKIKSHLKTLQAQGVRVALFGAGHLAVKFINFYGLAEYLIGVIDDNANKAGNFMPGSKLPVIGSTCLDEGKVDVCLLTLNPESEQKVLKAKSGYIARGGKFRSIFSASTNSIDQDFPDA